MKNKILLGGCVSVLLLAACTEQMNYNEYNIYDKDYITLNFNNVGGFLTDIYNTVEYDYGNFSNGAMLSSATDESEYSIMGNAIEDYYNGGWSPSNPKSTTWTNMYAGISACNTFLTEMLGLTFDELRLNQDYIRTARAKGLSEKIVIYRHALKNSMIPVITIFGQSIPNLFGGAYITEKVFGWPGMGLLGVDAITNRDYQILMGLTLFTAILVMLGNLLADIMYSLVDPRIRY